MINIPWKDRFVLLVIRDCVPLTIIVTAYHITDRDVICVLRKSGGLSRRWLAGNQLAIRKKPPVTNVGLNQNMRRSCWCIM